MTEFTVRTKRLLEFAFLDDPRADTYADWQSLNSLVSSLVLVGFIGIATYIMGVRIATLVITPRLSAELAATAAPVATAIAGIYATIINAVLAPVVAKLYVAVRTHHWGGWRAA